MRLRLDVHQPLVALQQLGEVLLDGLLVRGDLGPLRDDGAVDVAHLVPGVPHQTHRLLDEHVARAPLPLWVVVGEALPDVRQPERAGDGVEDAVEEHVAVGVRDAPAIVLELDPAEPELEIGNLGEELHAMEVEAVADPHRDGLDVEDLAGGELHRARRDRAAASGGTRGGLDAPVGGLCDRAGHHHRGGGARGGHQDR